MVTYPVHIKRDHYGGRDTKKRQKASDRNRVASELEEYINQRLLRQEVPVQATYAFVRFLTASRVRSIARAFKAPPEERV